MSWTFQFGHRRLNAQHNEQRGVAFDAANAVSGLPVVRAMLFLATLFVLIFFPRCAANGNVLRDEASSVSVRRTIPDYLTGKRFEDRLRASLIANWNGVPLRELLETLSAERRVSILLDRRIDPGQPVELNVNNDSLTNVVRRIAGIVSAEVSIIGNVIYIGPAATARKLNTLAAIARQSAVEKKIPGRQRLKFSARKTTHWSDLQLPSELIKQVAETADVRLENVDRIQHDLWAWGTIPQSSFYESATLILGQFGLTFEWAADGRSIRLIEIPDKVIMTRRFKPRKRGESVSELVQRCQQEYPDENQPALTMRNGALEAIGTVEQLDIVDAIVRGKQTTRAAAPARKVIPLSRRAFTLQARNVPADRLLKQLEDSGIKIEYDQRAMAAANVNFKKPLLIDVREAKPQEFFKQIFDQLNVKFRIRGNTVSLTP